MRRFLFLFGDDWHGHVKLLAAAVVAAAAMVALGFTLIYRADSAEQYKELSVRTCHDLEKLKTDIRGTFEAQRQRILRDAQLGGVARAAALMNIDTELRRYAAKDCP